MSYILDALQKSQSEQNAEGVALRPHKEPIRKPINRWLSIGLVGVLLCNAGLLLWVFVLQDTNVSNPSAALETTARIPVATKIAADPVASTVLADEATASIEPTPFRAPTRSPIRSPKEAQTPRAKPPAQLVPIPLKELPNAEQSLYSGLSYSTHIYTDDPSLCAIVVDGQRLMAGDAFKGLKVVAITEMGVVFEENRRGQIRQVEVSVLEQWDGQ